MTTSHRRRATASRRPIPVSTRSNAASYPPRQSSATMWRASSLWSATTRTCSGFSATPDGVATRTLCVHAIYKLSLRFAKHPSPVRLQYLAGPEASLVAHPAAIPHVVTEIEVLETAASAFGDQLEDVERARRACGFVGIEVGVHGAHGCGLDVREADPDQSAAERVGELDRIDRGAVERDELFPRAVHPPVVAALQVPAVEGMLLTGGSRLSDRHLDAAVAGETAALRAGGAERRHANADHAALPAAIALRPVENGAETAEVQVHEAVVCPGQERFGEHEAEARRPPRQVGARLGLAEMRPLALEGAGEEARPLLVPH